MNTESKSKCCQASYHVEGGDEGTNHYECDKCGDACDIISPQSQIEEKEIVICAAIKMKDGYIIRGHRHADALRTASQVPRYKGDSHAFGENQGFVTSRNRYVNRIEGARIQKAAGIKSKMPAAF